MGLLMTQIRQIIRMRQISMAVLVSLVAVAAFTSFECKVEGAKWYHNGALSSGLTIEEVWERVEPK
jgi:hypothetical protein